MQVSFADKVKLALISALKLLVFVYVAVRLYFWSTFDYNTFTAILGFLFLCAEMFVLIHALGFLNYLKIVILNPKELVAQNQSKLKKFPSVAFVVASYKEPLKILENTLLCLRNLSYPNKQVYLLDDTRYNLWKDEKEKEAYKKDIEKLCVELDINLFRHEWHDAKAGIINDFIQCRQGVISSNYQLIFNTDDPPTEEEKYIAIFDADMNAMPDFAEPLVSCLENNPHAAFVQTPQYYTNFTANRVALAASLMQAIFYEYICEAKGISRIMLLCGTNVMIRLEALKEIGGIDCSTVTEDFATGFKLNKRGWSSLYMKTVSAFGMGPEDLGALFKQQFRWALGTVGLLTTILSEFFQNPFKNSFTMMREYLFSSSYYLIGWVYFILMLGPTMYIFFNLPVYMMPPPLYFALLLPYNIIINLLFFWAYAKRNYQLGDLLNGVILGIVSMPVYMKASLMAILGIKGKFEVTPKGDSHTLPMRDLWPQTLLGLICFSTIIYGLLRVFFEGDPLIGLLVNIFWSLYYFAIFSSIFYYNYTNKKD